MAFNRKMGIPCNGVKGDVKTMKKCTEYTLGKTRIIKKPDYRADDSYLGVYGSVLKPGCIIRTDKSFYEDHIDDDDYEPGLIPREHSFFYPPDTGEKIGTPEYKKCALLDYQVVEDLNNQQWGFISLTVSTTVFADVGLTDEISNSLYGIEDHWDKDSNDYHREVVDDLKHEVKVQLLKMGFSDQEIDESFKDAEEVDW